MRPGKLSYLLILSVIIIASSCGNNTKTITDTADIKDTLNTENITGVKKYLYEGRLVKEVTFKDGIKEGLCKNYYDDGRLKSTIIYSNNLKVDTSRWYYPEGMVYRASPYKDGELNGTQIKYYKSGKVQAEIPYRMGLRLPGLKEYFESGSLVKGMPSLEYEISDKYFDTKGFVRVVVKLSNGSNNVKYYRGTLSDGAFDPSRCTDITASSGIGHIELKADSNLGKGTLNVIAVYYTRFGNKEIITKKINLPYKNLY